MAAACGLTIVKKFLYRGDATEEYSNTYWFTGSAPTTAAAWRTFFDEIVTTEKAIYHSGVTVIRGYGYNDDDGHKPDDEGDVAPAVWTVDLTIAPETPVAGTLTYASSWILAGDSAVWLRAKTSRVTSPGGKPIYLRKYYHPAASPSSTPDVIAPNQKAALVAHATKLTDGTLATGRKWTTAGKTDVITAVGASAYTTVRTLKRRAKRAA